jgi:hypothetical protein
MINRLPAKNRAEVREERRRSSEHINTVGTAFSSTLINDQPRTLQAPFRKIRRNLNAARNNKAKREMSTDLKDYLGDYSGDAQGGSIPGNLT